ncbi:hypothetical protein BVY01_01665 [bacterium I07]|nr:hypothetical protein BVY01_01665 [bacterium I07]
MKPLKSSQTARLFLELLMVFLGVYLAFLFSAHSEKMKAKSSQVQLLRGLNQEVDYFLKGATRRSPVMNEALSKWNRGLENGKFQTPLYFVMKGAALPTNSMWQVVTFFDGIQLLDVSTMFELSKYYKDFDIMLSKYTKLIDFAENEIIPYEDTPKSFFITKGRLKAKYKAYCDRNADFLTLFDRMIKQSEAIKGVLESEMTELGVDIAVDSL